jgi:hypothetical protein
MNRTLQVATGPKALVAGIAITEASGAVVTQARLIPPGAQIAVVSRGFK